MLCIIINMWITFTDILSCEGFSSMPLYTIYQLCIHMEIICLQILHVHVYPLTYLNKKTDSGRLPWVMSVRRFFMIYWYIHRFTSDRYSLLINIFESVLLLLIFMHKILSKWNVLNRYWDYSDRWNVTKSVCVCVALNVNPEKWLEHS